ncbi:TonB-dependent siderophore receptor [Caballeronia sp. 15711]|uniref:TonB-dependent siderophore receptor n=1 Tax=Caballeronia sp. 15711 TaxID=3391029 RepID=UPI0039E47246
MSRLMIPIRSSVVACAVAVTLLGVTGSASAQPLNLPSQSLSQTLSQLSVEANVNIIAPESLVAGKLAPAISGDLSVSDALTRALQGTSLQIRQRDSKTWLIFAPEQTSTADKADAALPAITVSESSLSDGGANGFVSDNSTTALRTNTPISETPQSIQVIDNAQMQSQQIQSVTDALSMAGGVTLQNTGRGSPTVYIRGNQASTMTNGSDDTGYSNGLSIPIAGVEQVEVLKGADSILSGAMAPGGVVNVALKQPTAIPVHQVTLQTGSYGDWLSSIDLGGPLTSDDRLTYRFILSGERAGETFGGFDGAKTLYIAPSIGWKSGDTSVVLAYTHNVKDEATNPVALFSGGALVDPDGREVPQGHTLMQSNNLSVDFKQKLGGIFEFEDKSQYQTFQLGYDNIFYPLDLFMPGEAEYLGVAGGEQSHGYDSDNHVRATFSLGPVKQTILAGFDYSAYWSSLRTGSSFVIGAFPAPTLPPYAGTPFFIDGGKSYSDNGYLQDQLSWGRLHVLASISRGAAWGSKTALQAAWSPNFGVLYQLTDNVAAYANLFRSFDPQIGEFLLDGSQAPPSTGRTAEAGFKFEFLDDRLTMTADAYRASILNMAEFVPGTANSYTLTGGQVTRGFEWSATGHVLPGLNLVVNYTYSDEIETSSGTSLVPRHVGNIWATYDLPGEKLHGWGLAIGLQPRTHYKIAGTSSTVPGQVETDASVYYKAKTWTATFGVKNVFNNTLYQNNSGSNAVELETSRVMYLTGIFNF